MKSPNDARLADLVAFFYSGRQKNSPGAKTLGRKSFGTRATDAPRISGSYARRPDCGERAARSQWFKGTNAGSRSVRSATASEGRAALLKASAPLYKFASFVLHRLAKTPPFEAALGAF